MRRQLLLLSFFWFIAVLFSTAIGQMQANFPERYRVTVKGDMIIVGNTMLSPIGNGDYNDPNAWNYFGQQYVDIDGDSSTFNSSSARVNDPNPGGACPRKVKKAYLYWASMDNPTAGTADRVKFKVDSGAYQDIIGTLVSTNVNSGLYVYIADVTDKLTSVAGNYTVANLQAPNRYAAGWTLFIIYEDATKPARNISLFDGLAIVDGSTSAVIDIQGFKTVPSPLPVNAKIGFASLEGDAGGVGDQLFIKTNKIANSVLSSPGRPSNNFFNSTYTDESGINLNRTPKSKNLMGYDAGILQLENANNRILDNNSTWAKLTATTNGDVYYPFMFAFNVEVIEPTVVMNKRVYNAANQDVTGQNNIALGSTLKYEIEFQNQGNDDAKNLTITDILPPNLENSATGIYVSDSRITYNYDPNTRKLTVNVPNDLVKQNGSKYKISFNVKVVPKCDTWTSPCANKIQNSASATYQGTRNPATFTPKSSNAQFSACGSTEESSTDFLVGVDFSKCTYKTSTILCQPTMNLTAAADFDSYTWTKEGDSSFSRTGRTISINAVGTYKVTKTKAGCATMYEEFEVKPNDHEADHPLENKIKNKEISGEVYVCPSTGQKYPQVYLCGKNASVEVKLKIDNAKSFQWGKMAASCPSKQLDCPASAPSQSTCWSNDGALINGTTTQKTFNADGDYKLTVTYDGDCVATYYFRVTKDQTDLDADVVHKVCNTQGSIKAKGISGSGYKYQLKQGNTVVRAWQTSVEFKNLDPGTYMLQATLPTANTQSIVTCVYEKEVTIEQITPSLQVTATNPLCNGGLGALQIQLSYPPYFPYTYKIIKDGQVVAQQAVTTQHLAGLTVSLTAGSYTVKVENNYGCTLQQTKNITDPAALKLDLGVRHNLCGGIGGIGGKIIAKAQGGTPNSNGYTLELRKNGTVVSRTTTQSGVYTFTVDAGAYEVKAIDGNNCNKTATATVIDLPIPSVTVTYTLYDCGARGKITFSEPQSTVTYTYQYSLTKFLPTNGAPIIQSGREFPGLTAGDYFTAHVHYTYAGETCTITIRDIQVPNITADNNLIASAGVSKLIGCFDGTDADKGEIRFSNVQGGVPPYEFSFDGGATWTSTRVMRKPAGSYNLAVRDAIECARTGLQVTIPAKVTQPTFTPTITYNCEGKGTYVQNSSKGSAYTYTYQLNGGTSQSSNTFGNLAPGTYTITIHYADANPPSKNVLFLEDFGQGTDHVRTPYINDAYVFEPQNGSTTLYNRAGVGRSNPYGDNVNDGEYTVVSKMRPNLWGDDPVDHTGKTNGRILFVNIGNSVGIAGILYQRKMTDITPNKPIQFSIALYNLVRGDGVSVNASFPKIGLELYRTEADALAGTNRLAVKDLGYIPGHANVNDWKEHNIEMNSGNNTELVAVVRSYSNVTGGNDLAMDDIYLYQEPEACTFSYTTTFKIESGKEFGVDTTTEEVTPVKCKGGDGTYKIKLKNINPVTKTYYYSVNGAAFVQSSPSNDTFTLNKNAGTYTVKFRGELNNANCEIVRTFTITEPAQLQVTAANAQGDVTLGCTPKVTAAQLLSATGGTKPYTFAIYKGNVTITTIALNATATNTSFVFTQTGNYTIGVTDANGCKATTAQSYKIYEPKVLQLQPAANSPSDNNFCSVTGNNGKVTLKVVAINGANTQPGAYNNAPYIFKHNGSVVTRTYQDTYTFANLGVATHTFEVVDKYGCTTSTVVRLNKPLTNDKGNTSAPPTIIKGISCTAGNAGKAIIGLKPVGGYPSYSYKVYRTPDLLNPIDGNGGLAANTTITYSTNIPGGYVIRVADNRGCEFYSGVVTITNPIPATISATVTSATCYGENNGVVSVTINGGAAPFRIKLNSTDANWTSVTGNKHLFTNVSTGTHNMVVKDANDCEVTQPILIAAPTLPLKAFAGVSQLVGCGNGANANKAKVRFTNVSGGWGDYQYKYDGGFSIYSEGWIPPGTHTITVKDKGGCEYDVRISVPDKIAQPTGTTYTIVTYDCAGNGTVKFTGAPSTYSYTYIVGGKTATGTVATITGLAPGTYTATIRYTHEAALDSNLLFREDFGSGPKEALPAGRTSLLYGGMGVGYYEITNATLFNSDYAGGSAGCGKQLISAACAPNHVWVSALDHTSNGTDPQGRFFATNAKSVMADGELFYRREVTDVKPNSDIKWEFYILNLFREDEKMCSTIDAIKPNIRVQIKDRNGVQIGNFLKTGEVPNSTCGAGMANWRKYEGTLNVGNNTSFTIEFLSNASISHAWANDFLIDDISVYQVPKSCPAEIEKTVVIPSGQQFKGSVLSVTNVACNGYATGKATLKVENLRGGSYMVQISPSYIARTGAGYTTPINSNTFEITQLQKGNYTITFRYTPAHSGLGSGCVVTTTLQVTEPTEIGLTATQTVPAMCSNNNVATVKLTATGGTGTGTYKYIYYDANMVPQVATQTSNIFTGVKPGVQNKFKVIDANNCSKTITLYPVDVPAKKTVSFTLEATDCYANDQQGEVKVRITDGNGNYRVKIGAGNLVSPTTNSVTHSFTGLRQGNHLVTVEDGYGCQTTGTIVIYPALNYTLKTTHQGSCSGAQGKIEVTARGGDGNIRYYFKKVGGTLLGPNTSGTYPIPSFSESSQTWVVYIQSARCEKTETVTINNVTAPTGFTLQTVTPTCTGGENGSIVVGGLAQAGEPYRVEVWHPDGGVRTQTGVTNNTPYTYTNAKAGLYTVTVRDTYGCSVSRTVRVGEMPDLSTDFELKVADTTDCPAAGAANTLTLTFSSTTWAANVAVADIYYRINSDNTW
ncbi:isopeptide-forming domain-containing fimbrial protein, partial [Capnocytophaga bilenii]